MSGDHIKNTFELKNYKQRFLLCRFFSNDSSKPQGFSIKDIEEAVDNNGQNWFNRAQVGKYLGLVTFTAQRQG